METFSAIVSAQANLTYPATMHAVIAALDVLETDVVISSEDDYDIAAKVKGLLSSAYCFAFNARHEMFDRISACENRWGQAMYKYNRRFVMRSGDAKSVANYLLCKSRWVGIPLDRALNAAKLLGILRRNGNGVCIWGLEKRVGDNLFNSRTGQRRYYQSIGRQAFYVPSEYVPEGFADGLPPLEPHASEACIANTKGGSRPPTIPPYSVLLAAIERAEAQKS